ncbi:MAG: DUF2723 domain-containing protein [Deltaproteobacteria bacterium]|nr:MAG: DUF2723 domain-containing protein [Deltaproteobacteria bacterium]
MAAPTRSAPASGGPPWTAIAFAASFAAYAAMAAPGVTWMDSGELAAAAWSLGAAHPPGHPLYVLAGKLASLVPAGEVAFRLSLVSAAAMAAAVAGAVALARTLVPGATIAALLAGGIVAASPLAAANATRPEVYGPTVALVAWAAVAAVRVARHRAPRDAALAVAALAAAAAIHPAIAAAAGLPLVAAVVPAIARAPRAALAAGVAAVAALAAYAALPVRAAAPAPPPFAWGSPDTLSGFADLVGAAAYRGNFAAGGWAERFASLWMLAGEGAGLAAAVAGAAGLAFAALTGLPGAAFVLASAACTVAGAAMQRHVNPDMPGYVLPAVVLCAAGVAPLCAAIARALPAALGDSRVAGAVVAAPVAALAIAGPVARADDGGPRRRDDALRHWDATVGRLPPGPALFFANADYSLFPALYERVVAGARPDVGLANRELVRDAWFAAWLDRSLPELYVPWVDDGRRGRPADRLLEGNLRAGRYVGGDEPAFGALPPSHAAPAGRAWRYALAPIDDDAEPPPPPRYEGGTGRRVAGRVGLLRGMWEAERGRLAHAARAAGAEARFASPAAAAALARPTARPYLFGSLPARTPVIIFAPWQRDALADDLAWRAGLGRADLPADAPFERRLLSAWHALVDGDAGALAGFDRDAQLATARAMLRVGEADRAEAVLAAHMARDDRDAGALVLLGAVRGNRGDAAEAARLFRRATELAPGDADAFAQLGLALAKLGRLDDARAAWQRALALDPGRRDVAAWLARAGGAPDAPARQPADGGVPPAR